MRLQRRSIKELERLLPGLLEALGMRREQNGYHYIFFGALGDIRVLPIVFFASLWSP
jgi:hypothetical protein